MPVIARETTPGDSCPFRASRCVDPRKQWAALAELVAGRVPAPPRAVDVRGRTFTLTVGATVRGRGGYAGGPIAALRVGVVQADRGAGEFVASADGRTRDLDTPAVTDDGRRRGHRRGVDEAGGSAAKP